MELNDQQQQVVRDLSQPILLNAPAGTGKTRVLACRVAHILETKAAEGAQILCLTFTNRACKELKGRIVATAHEKGLDVVVKTIHSFCYSLIKEETKRQSDCYNDFLLYDDEDCRQLIDNLPAAASAPGNDTQALQNYIEFAKKQRVLPDLHDFTAPKEPLQAWLHDHGDDLVRQYDAVLADNHAVDFTDLITGAYDFLTDEACCQRWRDRFRFIAVDEMQDTSEVEYAVISRLFPGRNVLLCGDYFQTIYEWRGSYPEYILEQFRKTYHPREITFTTNYRATQLLLKAAEGCLNRLFGQVTVHHIYPQPGQAAAAVPGDPIVVHKADNFIGESRWIFQELMRLPQQERLKACVLVRGNRQAQQLWTGINAHNQHYPPEDQLPVTCIDQFHLFKRQECKDVLAYLRLLLNKHDNLSLKRILLRFVPRIGRRTVETIESESYRRLGLRLCDFIDPISQETGDPYGLLLSALDEGRIVVFDVESTGTDTTRDEIIQIAAVRLDAAGQVTDTFNTYVRASRPVGASFYVHHISDETLEAQGMEPRQALTAFLDFAKDAVIVGHNVTYDLSILGSELARLGLSPLAYRRYYDTLDIFRRFYPNLPNHKLEYLGEFCHVSHRSTHDAMDDVCATAEILVYAIEKDIRPHARERKEFMEKWQDVFNELAGHISSIRREAVRMRPWQLLAKIVVDIGIDDYYRRRGEAQRIENLRDLFRQARAMDDSEARPFDALMRFLNYVTLSNTNLDAMTKRQQIPIVTVHQAKGAEFDYVFVAGLQEGTFPGLQAEKNDSLDEEARLFYVAITRPKRQLFLSWCQTQYGHYTHMSRFLLDLPREFVQNE